MPAPQNFAADLGQNHCCCDKKVGDENFGYDLRNKSAHELCKVL